VKEKVSPAQVEAMGKWGVQQKGSYDYLKTIKQPTLGPKIKVKTDQEIVFK
jgi:hypothetical protein